MYRTPSGISKKSDTTLSIIQDVSSTTVFSFWIDLGPKGRENLGMISHFALKKRGTVL
jgi:hypothetical protein